MSLFSSRISRRGALAVAALLAASPADAQTIAITGGKVYPVSGAPIEHGTVLLRDGKIVAVGADVTVPADARRIDATGKWVTPGFVNAFTQLGVVEIGAVPDTRDGSARGKEGIAAAFRVADGLNPRSALIAPARADGVTSAVVMPSGGLVAGQAAFIDLTEGSADDLIVRSPLAMLAQIASARQAGTDARGELLGRLR
ncbi:MAG TPA: hypothetical protein VFY16_11535, partial [Gemmatimonadaceae bacterium]|nr:hypothetical protein [Gemmatimonadaceae bacterium]